VTALLFVLASLPVGFRLAEPDAAAEEDAERAAEFEMSDEDGGDEEEDEDESGDRGDEDEEAGQAETGGGFLPSFFSSDGIIPRVLLPVHIVLSGLMNLVGPFQFDSVVRRRWPSAHRRLGYTFFPAAIGAGVTAIMITVINPTRYTTLNYLSNWAFGGWLAATAVMALVMIRRRQIRSHQRWAIRAFGAALTVAIHRVWGVVALAVPPLDSDAIPADVKDIMLSLGTIAVAEALARRSGGRRGSRRRSLEPNARSNRRGQRDLLRTGSASAPPPQHGGEEARQEEEHRHTEAVHGVEELVVGAVHIGLGVLHRPPGREERQ
jgi:hypothetical protein